MLRISSFAAYCRTLRESWKRQCQNCWTIPTGSVIPSIKCCNLTSLFRRNLPTTNRLHCLVWFWTTPVGSMLGSKLKKRVSVCWANRPIRPCWQGYILVAQARYDEILLDNQAFDIYAEDDYEKSQQQSNGKPIKRTKSAVRLINLLESITNTYILVPSLVQKFKFFADIQLDLLGQYQKRLSAAIDSFEALSLIRSVPVPGALPEAVTGVMTASETGGTISALNRLYRWWTSARSISDVMKDWTEEEVCCCIQACIMTDSNF